MSIPPSDIETGVSNGDVDWLFRGKSKKLNKKLHLDKAGADEDRLRADDKDNGDREREKSGSRRSVSMELALSEQQGKQQAPIDPEDPKYPLKAVLKPTTARSPSSPAAASQASPSTPPQQPRRRSSISFMSLGNSGSNGSAHDSDSSSSQPPLRSNSGRGRSFLSSLSLKFKSSGNASPSSAPPAASTKLNPNMIGSGSQPPANQDLASLVNRPPAEAGISIPQPKGRRSSFSASPKLSVDSERGGFFKRRTLNVDQNPPPPPPSQRVVLNRNKNKEKVMREFADRKLKRVAFALDKLSDDPQQQIPSRRPKKGNVLIPEDLTAPLPRLSQGISVSDGKGNKTSITETKYTEKELQMAIEAQRKALAEAEKHAMDAHLSAKRLAAQISLFKTSNKTSATIEEDEVDIQAEKIEIDKPLHVHENHFDESSEHPEIAIEDLSLEDIYARCCHLREILPIPATLKQLKNKTSPLQVLKLLNPKPTLIDVLSFSDFLAITPINTVIFDNVTMTTEMLKHLLAALVHSKTLEKLSLRNVAIDETGWLYLCEFLGRNRTVKKLDISQQRVKTVTKQTSFRSAMNWDLFIKTLVARGGIEELVMGGCKLSDETFEKLLEQALTISTCRLGVAATEINLRKCEMIADWISRPNSKCVGIDIAYNDLSNGQLRPFIEAFNTKETRLIFFSLNATNLQNMEEVGELLRGLAKVQTLRFLDLSSLPQLFPGVISKLSKTLPLFPSLRRVHFDLNELTSQSIDAIADILPKVKNLVHVSLLGNRTLTRGCIGSLYTAVKNSNIFNLDLDYDIVPDELSQRLALYLMKNLDRQVRPDINSSRGDTAQDDVMFDGSLLMETAEKMLIESDKNSEEADLKLQKIITNALIERTNSIRKDIHKIIDDLFQKRASGTLNFEDKESLLRFCLLDASLEKVVHLFEQKAKKFTSYPMSPSPSAKDDKQLSLDLEISPGRASEPLKSSDHQHLHESSKALIDAGPILMAKSRPTATFTAPDSTFEPHLVVVESSSDGLKVPIDNTTGRPVLFRSMSQTSLHAKEQEKEEGEFHRWGYFMEHRKSEAEESDEKQQEKLVIGAVPSGSELREAIIEAKGVDSVTDLISKISTHRVSLDGIYNADKKRNSVERKPLLSQSENLEFKDAQETPLSDAADDSHSIDSGDEQTVHPVVDEAYDKLLNEAQRVRSNKDCAT
uniref:Uncharacterized protein n=1 Tax=Candidozyma auris TaxID=498019 RepID=A0A0L0P7B5_CANAR